MRRLFLYLIVALLTFAVGSTLPTLRKVPKPLSDEVRLCLKKPITCTDQDLKRRIGTIDEEYTKRCLVYMEDRAGYKEKPDSGWIARCYLEWEEARRVAVEGE